MGSPDRFNNVSLWGLYVVTLVSKQQPLVSNESGWVPCRGHILSLLCKQTDAKATVCKIWDNTIPWMTATSLQVQANYLRKQEENRTQLGNNWRYPLEISALLLSFVWIWCEGLMRMWGKHLWNHKAPTYLGCTSVNVLHAFVVCDLMKWRWWKM